MMHANHRNVFAALNCNCSLNPATIILSCGTNIKIPNHRPKSLAFWSYWWTRNKRDVSDSECIKYYWVIVWRATDLSTAKVKKAARFSRAEIESKIIWSYLVQVVHPFGLDTTILSRAERRCTWMFSDFRSRSGMHVVQGPISKSDVTGNKPWSYANTRYRLLFFP